MKKYTFPFLLLLTMTFFTSCLELTEEVSMNKDGSGSTVLTVNLSESKDNIKHYMDQKEYQGMKIPQVSEIQSMIDEMETVMKGVDGLTNVQSNRNFDDFVFSFSGDFTDVDVLNKAVNVLAKEMSKKSPTGKTPVIKDNFSYAKGTFRRLFDYPIAAGVYDQLGFMEKFMLENARLVGIYRFPETVKTKSNDKASLSASQKSVMIKTTAAEIIKGQATMANEITY